jgi:hypothetical protein
MPITSKPKKRLKNLEIFEISLVSKPAVPSAIFVLRKKDDGSEELVLNHGPSIAWFEKRDEPDFSFVLGPVLTPEETDLQGDIISAEEIESAAHGFVKGSMRPGLQHRTMLQRRDCEIVESYVTRTPATIGKASIPVGSWMLAMQVYDPTLRKAITDGVLVGFSVGGQSAHENVKSDAPADDLTDPKLIGAVKTLERMVNNLTTDSESLRKRAVHAGLLAPTFDDLAEDQRVLSVLNKLGSALDEQVRAADRLGEKLARAGGRSR